MMWLGSPYNPNGSRYTFAPTLLIISAIVYAFRRNRPLMVAKPPCLPDDCRGGHFARGLERTQ